jgi:hypothetical protein
MRSNILFAVVVISLLTAPLAADPPVEALLSLHSEEAAAYKMWRDKGKQEKLELQSKPVFTWTNPVGEQVQTGHIFIWTHEGRPEAIGTIFSTPTKDMPKRVLIHEFHSLATSQLFPETPSTSREKWTPQTGIVFRPIKEAPAVESSPTGRTRQLKALADSFRAKSIDQSDKTVRELRILPRPLARYETKGEVKDGVLFAFVSSDGTDPEVIIAIEARPPKTGGDPVWQGSIIRFSDKHLVVSRDDEVLFSSQENDTLRCRIEKNWDLLYVPDRTYMCYKSHLVPELPDRE